MSKTKNSSKRAIAKESSEEKKQVEIEKTDEQFDKEKRPVSKRPIWLGRISIGLINVPVKLYAMVYDRGVSFRLVHEKDSQPLRYNRVCMAEDKVVPWNEVAKGYEVTKSQYVVFNKEELEALKPESDKRIRIDKFVDYFSVDPVYFNSSYTLLPDKSEDAYSLLLESLESMNKAAVGRITLRTKEYPALIHAYKGALVLTTLRYNYDVIDPHGYEELEELRKPENTELNLAKKIINELSGEFDIGEYKDNYRRRVEEIIDKKLKGETITVEKPPKEEVKGLLAAIQETLRQLEKK